MCTKAIFSSIAAVLFAFRVQCAPVTAGLPANVPSGPKIPSNIPSVEAIQFMKRFGYLDQGLPDSEALYREDAIIDAIKTVQKFGAIPETGKLDNNTIKLMQSKRCGVPDVNRDNSRRTKRYIIGSEGWKKRKITYFVANWSPKIGEEAVVREIQKAFNSWSGYARLTFQHVQDPSADILVAFGRGPHGDGYPFDGPGNILAHAFYPYEMGNYGGDIHFDDDEDWKMKPSDFENGVDFFTVAVHELGHSLGLAHSPISSSIMFPYYKGYQPNFQLDYDDLLAMYDLYISRSLEGDNETHTESSDEDDTRKDEDEYDDNNNDDDNDNTPDNDDGNEEDTSSNDDDGEDNTSDQDGEKDGTSPNYGDVDEVERGRSEKSSPLHPSSTPRYDDVTFVGDDETVDDHIKHDTTYGHPTSPTIPDICTGHYDAIAVLRSELFVFRNEYAWRLSQRNEVQPGYPVPFRQLFWKLPESVVKIDCAYQRDTDQNIILFTGDTYWVFNGDDFVENSPRPTTDYGLPKSLSHVDACMVWNKSGKTFLFSGNQYWRYNETTRKMDPGYPHNITRWRGVPTHLDAAMTWTDSLTYFFKGNLFWQFNNKIIKTEDSYPQLASKHWLGCS